MTRLDLLGDVRINKESAQRGSGIGAEGDKGRGADGEHHQDTKEVKQGSREPSTAVVGALCRNHFTSEEKLLTREHRDGRHKVFSAELRLDRFALG